MRIPTIFLCSVACIASTTIVQNVSAQMAPISDYFVRSYISSGPQINTTAKPDVLFSHAVRMHDASSFQIAFGRTLLPEGTKLRMTSYFDGATQHLTASALRQWNNKSAWFNGSHVLVELIAEPNSTAAHVTIEGVMMIEQFIDEDRSICGSTDDRALSYENRDARALPIGCSAWIIDDPNHTLLTAGHCTEGGIGDVAVIEFNVPLSDANGNLQHPGPEDQYASDVESLQSNYATIGNDWAYFGCFPNTETGLTPYQAQNDYYVLSSAAPPVNGQQITITGFGSTSSPVSPTYNQAQKTHTGPYAQLNGTSIAYQTDTSGGNSGSAVLNESTGEAIGIHTNAGCSSSGGENWGCAIHNSGLQEALANPQGVCVPNILIYSFANGFPDQVGPNNPFSIPFTVSPGNEDPLSNSVEVVLTVNGDTEFLGNLHQGGNEFEVMLPAFQCGDTIEYYFKAQGNEGTWVHYPYDAPATKLSLAVGDFVDGVILQESFEDGIPNDWSASGFWAATESCMPSGDCDGGAAAYFGVTDGCTYEDPNTASGALQTNQISIAGHDGAIVLSFCSALETEDNDSYDLAELFVNNILIDELDDSSGWQEYEYVLDVSGDSLQIEWRFNSVDNLYNNFRGWHIDGIQIIAQTLECNDIATCPADLNDDATVNVTDLLIVIEQWGEEDSPADISGDGVVDVTDLLAIVGAWGAC